MTERRLMKIALPLAALIACLVPSFASADALPDCPPGTRMVTNPIPEGAMHHAGARCVEEAAEPEPPASDEPATPRGLTPSAAEQTEGGGGCSAASGRGHASLPLLALGLAMLLVRRRG